MTGYQKLKQKYENLETEYKVLKEIATVREDYLIKIARLKGPECLNAPELAMKALWGDSIK